MIKAAFLTLGALNLFALYRGSAPFFFTFAQLPINELCSTEALMKAFHSGMEDMRSNLFPSLFWLGGIAVINLAFAGAISFMARAQPVVQADAAAPHRLT